VKVWVTRSQPGADRQAAELRGAGHEPVVAPVVRIEATGSAVPAGSFDDLVFISEHAVRAGLPVLRAMPWFVSARVFAVGRRTATVLAEAGVRATAPDDATSEGLLDLDALADMSGRSVLLVCGVGGRDLLQHTLGERGARVARFECYRREPVRRLDPRVLVCEAIIAASGEGLRQAARLWLEGGGRNDVPVLVPSERVAGLGVEVGLTSLHDCDGADTDAWLRGLKALG
jgi:uroporphyrinogen-III synthase